MRRLTHKEVSKVLELRRSGLTIRQISEDLDVSDQAIWYWISRRNLTADGIKLLRELHNKNWHLNMKVSTMQRMVEAAAFIIRMYEPSPRRRGNIVAPIRARFNLARTEVNRLVGLRPNAGEGRRATLADNVIIAMMHDFLEQSPRSGFETIFKAVLAGKPGTKLRALELYTNFFKNRRRKLVRATNRSSVIRRMQRQGEPNRMWSIDFMHALLCDGRSFWVLNAIDDFNREAVISRAMKNRSAKAVVMAISDMIDAGRKPEAIRTDNGGEFKSIVYKKFLERLAIRRVCTRYRVPNDNAYVEKFNDFVRREVLQYGNFSNIDQAQIALDGWSLRYNFVRPHGSLGGVSPMQFTWLWEKSVAAKTRVANSKD